MRTLGHQEVQRLAILTAKNAEVALLEITETGLKKSIMDATYPLRRLFKQQNVHDYEAQKQGTVNKLILDATIHSHTTPSQTKASLYRPETKQGDPRIWFYGLKNYARSGDILAITVKNAHLHLLNITQLDLAKLSQQPDHTIYELLQSVLFEKNKVSSELLRKLRNLAANGAIPSVIDAPADTAIGRTLEAALGISMNSNPSPDYKGIELKTYRIRPKSRQVRKTLFAQVPDWSLSKLKSSADILNAFGYERDGAFKLYCQVQANKRNSQGLMFRLDQKNDYLFENSDRDEFGDFATWPLERLRAKLIEKHAETFWVGAKQIFQNGKEMFLYTDVMHTKQPIASQLDILIEQGVVSMDHLIKRTDKGGAKEKGPLFKIEAHALELLFPPPSHYDLLNL